LLKSPNGTDIVCVVLIVVVVLVAIVEVLVPRVVVIVLGRTPIVVIRKTTNCKNKGVHINTRLLIFIVGLFITNFSYQITLILTAHRTVPLSLLNKTLLALSNRSCQNSGIYRFAFRQPVICLPMLSIKPDNSACFFTANNFISTLKRISNFKSSKSSKMFPSKQPYLLLYWPCKYFLQVE
jgi:hypothetical protein